MLGPCSAESDQRVCGRVVAALQRDPADGVGHALVGDVEESLQQFFGFHLLARFFCQLLPHLIQALAGAFRDDRDSEPFPLQPSQQQVDIGQRQRSPGAVRSGSGLRPGALRSNPQAAVCHMADRSPSGGDRFDRQRRGHQVSVADLVLKEVLEVPLVARHVRARPAHVKADYTLVPRLPSDQGSPGYAPRRSAQQTIFGAEGGGLQ